MALASWKNIYLSPEEILVLEQVISGIIHFLCFDDFRQLKRCTQGNASLRYATVGDAKDEFSIVFHSSDPEQFYQHAPSYPQFSGIKPTFILWYIANRITQLLAMRGYEVKVESRDEKRNEWLFVTLRRYDR